MCQEVRLLHRAVLIHFMMATLSPPLKQLRATVPRWGTIGCNVLLFVTLVFCNNTEWTTKLSLALFASQIHTTPNAQHALGDPTKSEPARNAGYLQVTHRAQKRRDRLQSGQPVPASTPLSSAPKPETKWANLKRTEKKPIENFAPPLLCNLVPNA